MKSDVTFRAYAPADRAACLDLFDGNTPAFFADVERDVFATFLDHEDKVYFVIENGGRIVACGGYEPDHADPTLACFCWGMVARDMQRKGFGERLARERLARISADPGYQGVILDTTPMSRGFFERLGFVMVKVTPDGYAPGYDRIDMRLDRSPGPQGICRPDKGALEERDPDRR